jgi:inorganic pyrophosphatase
MALKNVTAGINAPEEFNVIIEIPAMSDPIKYEVDKETGALFVDRFMMTAMHYPCNYGVSGGSVVRCRPLGVLKMDDEAGGDAKLLAVPTDKILPIYKHWKKVEDINPDRLASIQHFFEHYKDLEKGKWVKVQGWEGPESAKREIIEGLARYKRETGS